MGSRLVRHLHMLLYIALVTKVMLIVQIITMRHVLQNKEVSLTNLRLPELHSYNCMNATQVTYCMNATSIT